MSTKIKISYDNKDYVLEYNRAAVRQMEAQGFIVSQIFDKPMTMIPLLVAGAFSMHHKGMKRKLIDEIYDHITNKTGADASDGFVQALIEAYAETLSTLTEDGAEGNVATWKVTKD